VLSLLCVKFFNFLMFLLTLADGLWCALFIYPVSVLLSGDPRRPTTLGSSRPVTGITLPYLTLSYLGLFVIMCNLLSSFRK
jgi:hypothetical protein